jgi:hypothetical protein
MRRRAASATLEPKGGDAMSTHALGGKRVRAPAVSAGISVHWLWLAGGYALAFLVPFALADLLGLGRDLYYGLYALAVGAFFVAWARSTQQPLGALARRRWPLAVALGLLVGALLAVMVVGTEDATARPDGLALAGAVLWRGVVYGATDGLLLSAFPILAVFAAFAGSRLRASLPGRLLVGATALAASVAMAAVYHAGYAEFRSGKVAKPVAGDVAWSLPTLVTLNPIGAPIAHVGLHVSAVLHSYETDVFLPPHE